MKIETKHTTASMKSVTLRIVILLMLLLTGLLFLIGCKAKHTITEKTITKTDSTAIWTLNDSLYKKETLIAILKSDLQRLRDDNLRLLNESSAHLISYDTSAPVNLHTGKPPIATESFTVSKSTLEETKNEYETLLQTSTMVDESLTRQNHSLQITVEKLTNENKQLTEKSSSLSLNIKIFLAGLIVGILLGLIIYFVVRK